MCDVVHVWSDSVWPGPGRIVNVNNIQLIKEIVSNNLSKSEVITHKTPQFVEL